MSVLSKGTNCIIPLLCVAKRLKLSLRLIEANLINRRAQNALLGRGRV